MAGCDPSITGPEAKLDYSRRGNRGHAAGVRVVHGVRQRLPASHMSAGSRWPSSVPRGASDASWAICASLFGAPGEGQTRTRWRELADWRSDEVPQRWGACAQKWARRCGVDEVEDALGPVRADGKVSTEQDGDAGRWGRTPRTPSRRVRLWGSARCRHDARHPGREPERRSQTSRANMYIQYTRQHDT